MSGNKKWFQFLSALGIGGSCLYIWFYFLRYVWAAVNLPYDWEPTDGDHLNLALRLLKGQPIYTDWKDGMALDLYNPGYHYVMAALSPLVTPSMNSGRSLSSVAFLGCGAIIFGSVYYYKSNLIRSWKLIIALVAALSVVAVYFEDVLVEMTHITPNALYAFWSLLSLFCISVWDDGKSGVRIALGLGALFSFLAFFTKQHGAFCPATVFLLLAVRRAKLSEWLAFALISGGLVLAVTFYLELKNNGHFLQSTVFNVPYILQSPMSSALGRISRFIYASFPWVLLTSIGLWTKRKSRLSVWQISLPVQILFLIKTSGNGAGGGNYFFPLWCTLLICSGETVIDFLSQEKIRWSLAQPQNLFIGLAFLIMVPNLVYADYRNSSYLTKFMPDRGVLDPMMNDNYKTMEALMRKVDRKEVFASRNIGGWILAGADIDDEYGAVMSCWERNPPVFSREAMYDKFRNKKYAYVISGVQPFPAEFLAFLNTLYRPLMTIKTNLWMGQLIGDETIYVPK